MTHACVELKTGTRLVVEVHGDETATTLYIQQLNLEAVGLGYVEWPTARLFDKTNDLVEGMPLYRERVHPIPPPSDTGGITKKGL